MEFREKKIDIGGEVHTIWTLRPKKKKKHKKLQSLNNNENIV
jgi:hypothetical protein